MSEIPETIVRDALLADAMLTRPKTLRAAATADELSALFADDHVQLALLVEDGRLVGVADRGGIVPLEEVTASPDTPLAEARARLRRTGRRRLAVVDDDGTLLGLLCLKANGRGFCSDDDVAARRDAKQKPYGAVRVRRAGRG